MTKESSWFKEHEATLLSLVILAVTVFLSLQHTLSPEIVSLVIGGVSFVTVVLHGWNKALPVVPLASMEGLVSHVMTNLMPQALPLVAQAEALVTQAEAPSEPVQAAVTQVKPAAPVQAAPASNAGVGL